MAKSPEKVKAFEEDLAKKLQPLKEKEIALFLQYKKDEVCSLFAICVYRISHIWLMMSIVIIKRNK